MTLDCTGSPGEATTVSTGNRNLRISRVCNQRCQLASLPCKSACVLEEVGLGSNEHGEMGNKAGKGF